MATGTVRLVEADHKVTWTFTAKRSGSAINLTGTTVDIQVHLNGAADGTNLISYSGGGCTITDAAAGVFTFQFTSTHTANPGRGRWRARITTTATSAVEHLKAGDFIIDRNAGEA
jgi:hypothetical protein